MLLNGDQRKLFYTCEFCGSRNVFQDAWVGLNDPTDIRTFDATFCMDCEQERGVGAELAYE